jgi:hypothetical protein
MKRRIFAVLGIAICALLPVMAWLKSIMAPYTSRQRRSIGIRPFTYFQRDVMRIFAVLGIAICAVLPMMAAAKRHQGALHKTAKTVDRYPPIHYFRKGVTKAAKGFWHAVV